jgi:hypothetical protein
MVTTIENNKHNYTNIAQVIKNSLRLTELLQRQRTTGLSPGEASYLSRYLQLERLLALAQVRARKPAPEP